MIVDNKKLLIGAGVVVVGYLLYKNMKNNQSNLAECTKEVEKEIANTMFKTGANFNMNEYKKGAIDKCLQNKTKDTQLGQKLNVPLEILTKTNNLLVPKDIIYDTANYNSITHKTPILGGTIGNIKYNKKNSKYYKQQIYPNATIPIEITENEYIDEFISKLPF